MHTKSLPEWEAFASESATIDVDQFFLKITDYPALYKKAIELSKQTEAERKESGSENKSKKVFLYPIEQLSPVGLAMMSHLYAIKDNSQRQPLIASTVDDFIKLVKLMDQASPGTEVTVILQPTDLEGTYQENLFSSVHKTVFKIKKTDADLQMINMDGAASESYGSIIADWTKDALKENSQTILSIGLHENELKKNKKKPEDTAKETFSRQTSEYECGVFAIKDARQMNRDSGFVENIMVEKNKSTAEEDESTYRYNLPPDYLKSIQSNTYANQIMPTYGKEEVTRRGKTLEQTRDKHGDAYIYHFSKKFHDEVQQFVGINKDKVTEIQEAVNRYDAGKITLPELEKRYGLQIYEVDLKKKMANLELIDKDSINAMTDGHDAANMMEILNDSATPKGVLPHFEHFVQEKRAKSDKPDSEHDKKPEQEQPHIEKPGH
jgi:hypothetical protein